MVQSIKYTFLSLLVGVVMLASCIGCIPRKAVSPTTKQCITVSIPPIYGLVKEIVGEDFEILVLLPEGSSPETFTPTVKQISAIYDSELFLSCNLNSFEKAVTDRLAKSGKVAVINIASGCKLIENEHISCGCGQEDQHNDDHHSHAHHHGGLDPHVWMSPFELEVMARNIGEAVCRAYPDSAKYVANTEALVASIRRRQEGYAAKLKEGGQIHLLIYHPALSYLARDYGLHQISLESEGKNPTPTSLAQVVEIVNKCGITSMMYQAECPEDVIKSIVDVLGVNLVKINPLSRDVLSELDKIINIISSLK